MTATELEQLKYPIGKHVFNDTLAPQDLERCLTDIGSLPARIKKEVAHFSAGQLDTPYRPNGWTVRQVIHHFSDSHMNAFIRFKLALTEDKPVIKPYDETAWAVMEDSLLMPIEPGLELITALHARWLVLLKNLTATDFQRIYVHPEYGREYTLAEAVSLYAWHGNHHLAHITALKQRNNWV